MRSFAVVALLVVLLGGCADSLPREAVPDLRLYAAEGGYRALLEIAVAYKEACDSRPPVSQARCRPIVAKLRAIDRRIAAVQARIDRASPQLADVRLAEAALDEFRAALVAATAGRGAP